MSSHRTGSLASCHVGAQVLLASNRGPVSFRTADAEPDGPLVISRGGGAYGEPH